MAYNHLTSLDGSTVDVKFEWAPDMAQTVAQDAGILSFDGRERPLAYFGEGDDETWDVAFTNDTDRDGDMWTEMRKVLDGANSKVVLLWTDTFGNDITVMVSSATWKPIVSGDKTLRRISFRMTRVEDAEPSS